MQHEKYDVVIVGARIAGAATASFLAAQGMRVLLLDKGSLANDPLSTHALMRLGVLQLKKLGVMDQLFRSGTPAIGRTVFSYDGKASSIAIRESQGVPALMAPRRYLLDPLLVHAAESRGVEVEFGCRVLDLVRTDSGRVCGVVTQREGSVLAQTILADWVVGADGASSVVARMLRKESPITRLGKHRAATMYTYLPCEDDAFHWLFDGPRSGRRGLAAGVIPTNDEEACVFFASHPEEFATHHRRAPLSSMEEALRRLAHPGLPELRFPEPEVPLHFRYFQGATGFMRDCIGKGWALVGDAGYFKDPATAHGISDALRDAELLAHALPAASEHGRRRYQEKRDDLSVRLFEVTDRIASLECDTEELVDLHLALSKEMKREVEYMSGLPSLLPDSQVAA